MLTRLLKAVINEWYATTDRKNVARVLLKVKVWLNKRR